MYLPVNTNNVTVFDFELKFYTPLDAKKSVISDTLFLANKHKQEGQHPLTGQRAANFRLLAKQ